MINHAFFSMLLNRINSRSLAMALAACFMVSGLYVVVRKIEIAGSIDLKAPFVQGKLESGSAGILLMFLGFVLVLACLFLRRSSTLSLKYEGMEFTYKGYISVERLERLRSLVDELTSNARDKAKPS